MSTIELLKSLGWKERCLANNRLFYRLGTHAICIHLHDGACYCVTRGGVNYHQKLDEEKIREYTRLINNLDKMNRNPMDYTLWQYKCALRALTSFKFKMSR